MLPVQCKMSRAALGWGVRELAAKAEISIETVWRFENGEQLRERTIATIRATLERAGAVFIDSNGGGPGVRLRKKGRR